jgi:hypothetical protein
VRGAHLITVSKSAREEPPKPPAAPETPAGAAPVVDDPEPRQIQELESDLTEIRDEREKAERALSELRSRSRLAAPAAPAPQVGEKPRESPTTVAPPAAESPVAEEPVGPKPTRSDFFDADDPDEAFTEALLDWKDKEREFKQRHADNERKAREEAERNSKAAQEEARKRKEAEDAASAASKLVNDEYAKSLKATRDRHADFDAVMQTPGELCSPAMGHVARNSANAEILYWLGSHPKEATRICAATQLKPGASQIEVERVMRVVYREFDKIEADIHGLPRSAAPQVRPIKKHTPVTPVASRGGSSQKTLTQMSREELRALDQSDYRKMRGL